VYYRLKDHLGSASVVTDSTSPNPLTVAEQRYYPYGKTRLTATMLTDKLFTGQRDVGLGIYHYGARFRVAPPQRSGVGYSPKLGRFLSPDTIVPGAANPQAYNRYSYVLGNPLKYIDPSGHGQCQTEEDCADMGTTPMGTGGNGGGSNSPPLLVFSNDENQSFTSDEMQIFKSGAWDIAQALAGELNALCDRAARRMGDCSLVTPQQAFYDVFGGPISVRRVTGTCGCWAMHRDQNANGLYEIWVYSSTSTQEITSHPNLIVHEIGHAFYWAAGGYIEGSSVGDRNGFYGPHYQWQFGQDSQGDLGTEIFADMFLGWVYGKWEPGELPSGLSINGQYKSDYMDKYMPLMINKAVGR